MREEAKFAYFKRKSNNALVCTSWQQLSDHLWNGPPNLPIQRTADNLKT